MKASLPLQKYLIPFLYILTCFSLHAQVTKETYQKAEYFLTDNLQKEIHHLEVIPNWSKDNVSFWHVTYTEKGKRFFKTNIQDKKTVEAFDHVLLSELIQKKIGEGVNDQDLAFDRIDLSEENVVKFEWKNQEWRFEVEKQTLTSKLKEKNERTPGISPDKKWRAFTKDYNLFVENLETAEEIQLSFHGKRDFEYASYLGWGDIIKGENGNRPDRFMVSWSPDSKKIYTQIVDLRIAEKMYMLDFSQEEKFRPELLSYYRGSPGDTTVVKYIPVIFDVESNKETILSGLTHTHFAGGGLTWGKESESLSGVFAHRGFKSLDIIEVDAKTGNIQKKYSESSDTNLERGINFRRVGENQFLLTSQKSGWNHIYLHDWKTGKLIKQLTTGDFVVNSIVHVDEDKKLVYFIASGREKDRNPYYQHLYKVNMDGTGLHLLTPENAFHEIHLSPDKKYLVDNYSTVNQPTRSVLRDMERGEILMEISKADISKLQAKGYRSPQPFSAIAKDGKTEIFGIYYLPTEFDASKSYPIIDYTYTGPHTASTPKTFKAGLFGHQQPMAELGFVVVTVDGLGTADRSKAFSDVSYRNLGDGTTDHVLAIKQLAEKNPYMDVDRVGIFGHSAGGYDAGRAMLLHPDFYKVGVASAGDHDHRMEKAWWPEMYMGYPVGDFYHEQSNITNAANLKGRLLLAHGGIDENVNPSATFKFAEALINAGKDFDLFIWPSRSHSFGRPPGDYFTKKRWDYFLLHLKGEEPLLHYRLGD